MTLRNLLYGFLLLSLPAFSQQVPRLSVTWNPNVETYFILERLAVERLGHYGYITKETDNAHQPMVKAGFEAFKSYKDSAIGIKTAALLDTLRKIHIFNDRILEVLLYTRPFPDTGYRYPLNRIQHYADSSGGVALIQPFIREMQQFFVSAHVGEFLERHHHFYEGAVKEVIKDIPAGIEQYMEHYYGEIVPSFTVLDKSDPDSLKRVIVQHFQALSKERGYPVRPSEQTFNEFAYRHLQGKNFDKAKMFFQLNIDYFPESFNVYDGMGDYYMELQNTAQAITYWKKACSIRATSEIKEKLEKAGVKLSTGKNKIKCFSTPGISRSGK